MPRRLALLVVFASMGLACSSEAPQLADGQGVGAQPSTAAMPSTVAMPSTASTPSPSNPAELAPPPAQPATAAEVEPAADTGELPGDAEQPPSASEPQDSLAPILPSGPAPGSPEADAELIELLEESTLTQEEFDKGFRGGGPKVDGDQFVFGPNERTRGRPRVNVGTPSVSGSSVPPSELAELARASLRDLEGCYAMALAKQPGAGGAVSLSLRFDADGQAASATIDKPSSLGASLDACLVSVAQGWRLGAAAGATVRLPLELSPPANE